MEIRLKELYQTLFAFLLGVTLVMYASLSYGVSGNSVDYVSTPPATSPPTPLAMLTMSNDHQLYYKAYTDWTDLDGDGEAETTYKNSFDYYGYFDPDKCYEYDSADGRFEPASYTSDHYCDSVSGDWSGNFLNWATMARMDIIRRVLYGGKRYVDTPSLTVLERTFIPTDAHSFAKFYDGADINKLTPFGVSEITLCNTTYNGSSAVSENVTDPPLVRVVEGDFRYWAANERWQCTFDNEFGDNGNGSNTTGSETSDPNRGSDGLGEIDYIARVEVCNSSLPEKQSCRVYVDASATTYYKPAGLLQTYGEEGAIKFGLLTGSYEKNKSGGVLRKNISDFSSEVNANGTFTYADGIVKTLDDFRISGYSYSNGVYNSADSCSWGMSSFTDGRCTNWGNPISEMFLEAIRYFAGEDANSAYDAPNDDNYINDLKTVAWEDPLNTNNYCASCNIIVINASEISYDDDSLDMSDILPVGSPITAESLTDFVGDNEGITGNDYFVGENGTDNNQLCTAKTVNSFGQVRGTCPGSPRLSGTFNIAGLAHWAHTEDIRENLPSDQDITTYSVALSPSTPKLRIPVPGTTNQFVLLLPACRNESLNPDANCAIVDFKIISRDVANGTGELYVNWEDSEQGGDYDQDMKGTLSYKITSTDITITSDVDAKSTPYRMGFGYIISGTTDDGFHVHSGINGFNFTDGLRTGCSNCRRGDAPTSEIYTIGSSAADFLEDPLYYTSKYGGFDDIDNDKIPEGSEWDLRDLDGNIGADGIPDTFFPVSNPTQLEASLQEVFNAILNKVAAGTAAAVVSNSTSGDGALYQALYQPVSREGNNTITWTGYVHGIFIDQLGQLREDNDSEGTKGRLDTCINDKIIEIGYDAEAEETQVTRYECTANGEKSDPIETVKLRELQTLWDARDNLNAVSNVITQRTYNSKGNIGRHIITFIDADTDGVVDLGEQKDFSLGELGSTATDPDAFRLLNTDDPNEADNIIRFIRGQEISGFRSRTIDYDNDGIDEVWRIGDIVSSTPAVSGAPNANYYNDYNDESYLAYQLAYKNRRQVVYVGANDGMIHAFNGGFYNDETYAFDTDNGTDADHALGDEIWAYVPYNLLPHLRWLTEEDYPHVYYMDGPVLLFDVKIFDPDSVHVNGWGTILVAPMRFGGGDIAVDHDNDPGTPDEEFRSAIVVLDVTDPESPPELLAEITHPDLGLTTSQPALSFDISEDNNEWYLVFGSGPNDILTGTSDETAKLFVYNLVDNAYESGYAPIDLSIPDSFVGSVSTVDWNYDQAIDAAYFGIAGGTNSDPNGRLMRFRDGVVTTLIDPEQPFISEPLLIKGQDDDHWVYSGSGRLFTDLDKTNSDQQSFYGIRESLSEDDGTIDYTNTFETTDLMDVTDIIVYDDNSTNNLTYTTWDTLNYFIQTSMSGWYFDFNNPLSDPSTRNVTKATQARDYVIFSDFTPDLDLCEAAGSSNLFAVNFLTGTAGKIRFLDDGIESDPDNVTEIAKFISLGAGQASNPVIHEGKNGRITIITVGSLGTINTTGTIPVTTVGERKSWREIPL